MAKESIVSNSAPQAIGPYSQAVRIGNIVYTSGQIPIDPTSTELVLGGIEEQTRQVFNNLDAVLSAAGTSLDNIVKTTVFLINMDDFAKVNEVYASYFAADSVLPARSAVQVARLPKNALVEIEAIAIVS